MISSENSSVTTKTNLLTDRNMSTLNDVLIAIGLLVILSALIVLTYKFVQSWNKSGKISPGHNNSFKKEESKTLHSESNLINENEAVYALVDERNKPQPSNGNKKLEEIDTIYANVNVAEKKETEKLTSPNNEDVYTSVIKSLRKQPPSRYNVQEKPSLTRQEPTSTDINLFNPSDSCVEPVYTEVNKNTTKPKNKTRSQGEVNKKTQIEKGPVVEDVYTEINKTKKHSTEDQTYATVNKTRNRINKGSS